MFFSLRSPIFLLIASLLPVTVKLPEGAAMDSGGSSNTPSNEVTVNYSPAAPFVDTDGDSYSDDAERAFGTSPEDPASIPDHRPVHTQPNLVIIYADDMGFGDVAAYGDLYGTTSPAPTPRMDQLASEGVMFTRAHSSNAVCTPSRYALLTGKYNWREFNGITASWGGERGGTIPRYSDVTIAEFLKTQGYDTAAFGKWHMSGSWYLRDGVTNARGASDPATVDWARPVEDHATAHGFDYFRGLATSINFGPYVYLADDRNQFWDAALNGGQGGYRDATNDDPFVMLTSSQIAEGVVGSRSGGDNLGDPSYRQIQAGPLMISQVEEYLAGRADVDDPDPFFAYVALYSPHTPVAPTEPFQGLTGYPYGDFVAEVDHRIGRVLDALEANGFGENTVVVLTSDNGPETFAMSGLSRGKDSNGPLRGVKRDAWEGGTRVPFIVRWPGQAAPGLISNDLIWQGDIFATIAAFLGVELPDDVAPDGESFLNLLHGQQKPEPQRGSVIPASMYGHLSFNTVDGWKLIDSTGGGGNSTSWDADNNKITNAQGTNQGEPKQLYQLTTDIGERENLIAGVTGDGAIRAEITARTGRDLLDLLDQYRLHPSTHFYERTPDNDADGMSNDFETTYQFDRDWPLDAGEDADSDSVTNLREAQNDLDPRGEDTDDDKLLDGEELDRIGSLPDDPGTPDLNEKLQLLVTSQSGVESLDADGDGMLDSQEEDVFGTLSRDGTGDYDGDGASDWFELALGSNARDAASLPALTLLLSQDNPGLAFRRHLRAGLGYKLLASEDLVNWEPALRYFEYAADQPPLESGADYEVIHLTPRQQLPEQIFITAEPHIFTP